VLSRYVFKTRPKPDRICAEAAQLLSNCFVSPSALAALSKMKPIRQAEAAEHILASGDCSVVFVEGLVAITPEEMLRPGAIKRVPAKFGARFPARCRRLQQQASVVATALAGLRDSYGRDLLALEVYCRFVQRMLTNQRISIYLGQHHTQTLRSLNSVLWSHEAKRTKKRFEKVSIGSRCV
jgi:RepB plasmid partitioning protein